jgi:hypothetical protein
MAVVVRSRPHLARGTIACSVVATNHGEGQPDRNEPYNDQEGKAGAGGKSVVAQGPALTTVFILVAASTWTRLVATGIGGHGQDGLLTIGRSTDNGWVNA